MASSDAQFVLNAALRELNDAVGGRNAFVFDAWGVVWGWARPVFEFDKELLFDQIKQLLEPMDPPLQRGGTLTQPSFERAMHCRSFAQVYVLAVWTTPVTNEFMLRRWIADALPEIEALTLALPPTSGPSSASGAMRRR